MAKSKNIPRLIEPSAGFREGNEVLVVNLNKVNDELRTSNRDPVKPTDQFLLQIDGEILEANWTTIKANAVDQFGFIEFQPISPDPIIPGRTYELALILQKERSPGVFDNLFAFNDFKLTLPGEKNLGQQNPMAVSLQPSQIEDTDDESLWNEIITTNVNFNDYQRLMDFVVTLSREGDGPALINDFKNRLPFLNVDDYSVVKFVTEYFMRRTLHITGAQGYFGNNTYLPYFEHLSETLDEIWSDHKIEKKSIRFLEELTEDQGFTSGFFNTKIKTEAKAEEKIEGKPAVKRPGSNFAKKDAEPGLGARVDNDFNIFQKRKSRLFTTFPAIELIWSYWMEQAMLVQSMNVVSLRFQNMKGIREIEPMMRFDTSPLRTLSNLLWGYVQDEQHRTTLHRRVFEYQHAYNLTLLGRAVPKTTGVDDRSNFLEAFHNLLHYATVFFKDYDDMTRRSDGFPLLTALREVHLLLAEGNHNAYYNMTWTTRAEMMTMQYFLARQEMRLFLGGRPMVPYPEHWMDRVDTMKMIQGWDGTSVLHYYDLATSGEKLLLGIRYGDWTQSSFTAEHASNWAVAFRDNVMKYVNAYRIVAGIDLSVDSVRMQPHERALQPALLIQHRLQAGKQEPQVIELNQQRRVLARRY